MLDEGLLSIEAYNFRLSTLVLLCLTKQLLLHFSSQGKDAPMGDILLDNFSARACRYKYLDKMNFAQELVATLQQDGGTFSDEMRRAF